jgi:hypothetical protein
MRVIETLANGQTSVQRQGTVSSIVEAALPHLDMYILVCCLRLQQLWCVRLQKSACNGAQRAAVVTKLHTARNAAAQRVGDQLLPGILLGVPLAAPGEDPYKSGHAPRACCACPPPSCGVSGWRGPRLRTRRRCCPPRRRGRRPPPPRRPPRAGGMRAAPWQAPKACWQTRRCVCAATAAAPAFQTRPVSVALPVHGTPDSRPTPQACPSASQRLLCRAMGW